MLTAKQVLELNSWIRDVFRDAVHEAPDSVVEALAHESEMAEQAHDFVTLAALAERETRHPQID